MRIQKIKDTFNDYRVELSWGQLKAVHDALGKDHADPIADETFAELGWYLGNVPGPGEDEEEYKQAREAEKQSLEMGDGGPGGERDPELLGTEVPPGGEPIEGGAPGGEEPRGAESPLPAQQPEEEEADRLLERPPGQGDMAFPESARN